MSPTGASDPLGRSDPPGGSVLIRDVVVVDGTGSPPGVPQCVIVVDGAIAYVGAENDASRAWSGDIVEGGGRVLQPGFIDLHVHTTSLADMGCYLANGVTTIRYAGIDAASISGVRAAIEAELPGPRVLDCGPMIDMEPPSWPSWSLVVADGDDARAQARRMLTDDDLDGLIVVHGASTEVVRAGVEVAAERGKPVVGQLWLQDAEEAAGLGVSQLDNTSRIFASRRFGTQELTRRRSLPERLRVFAEAWTSVDWDRTEPLMDAMVRGSVAYCPTFVSARFHTQQGRADLGRDGDFATMFGPDEMAQLEWFERQTSSALSSGGTPPDWIAATEARMEWVRRFIGKGGTVVTGTDAPFGGITFHGELANLVEVGLSPLQAVAAGTGTAARVAGCGDWLGTIAPGQRADLLLMAARPDEVIASTREIDLILVGGAPYAPDAFRAPPLV